MNSPCLVGRGAGASLAARIIAKERFYSPRPETEKIETRFPSYIFCPQEDGDLVRDAHQPVVSLLLPGWGDFKKKPEWEDFFQKDFPWVRTTFSSFIPPPRLLDC